MRRASRREPVAQVDHRGGTGDRREPPIRDRRRRRELRPDGRMRRPQRGERIRRATAASDPNSHKSTQPGSSVTEHPRNGDDIPDPRARTKHRRPAFQVAKRGHRDRQVLTKPTGRRRRRRTRAPWRRIRLAGHRRTLQETGSSSSRGGKRHNEPRRHSAHRRNIGQIGCRRLPAEVMRARPRQPEVRAVNHHVGRDDESAVRQPPATAASSPGPIKVADEDGKRGKIRARIPSSPIVSSPPKAVIR